MSEIGFEDGSVAPDSGGGGLAAMVGGGDIVAMDGSFGGGLVGGSDDEIMKLRKSEKQSPVRERVNLVSWLETETNLLSWHLKRKQILFVEISTVRATVPKYNIQTTEREMERLLRQLSQRKREKEKEGGFVAAIAGIRLSH
ncbi:hypothetical protein Acr_01g0000350 [Actinidia rufa]|uniref:Uncharacterized protein n=1 Tax=Actinidia rufa TaxID=165716 RepID=A0A7J0E256_9ERIC|nr:hypothetical protein Acr_01g0000350 [Actinidia rufa]